jgi:Zn-dependent protease with chaperone function
MVRWLCVLLAAAYLLIGQDKQKETALGASLARDIRRQNTVVEDVLVRGYIERVGRRLAAKMAGVDVAWTFEVVRENWGGRAREPVALPGGFVFVPAPLLVAAKSEDEFVRMLAHAMAHVAERHGMIRVERGSTAQSSGGAVIYMGGFPFGLRQWRPEEEAEADQVASRIAMGAEASPQFAAVQNRVRELTMPGTMQAPRTPSLRRRGER